MKKVLALILSMLLVVTVFVSCGDNEKTNEAGESAPSPKHNVNETGKTDSSPKQNVNVTDISFESILANYVEATKGVDNVSMKMDMDMTMSLMGQTVDMVMSADYEIDGNLAYMNMDIEMPSLGQTQTTETYMDIKNYVQYVSVEGDWYKTAMDDATIEALEKSNGMQMDFSIYSKYMKNGTITETDYHGTDCYELTGVIDIDYMELIDMMNLDSLTGSLEEAGLPEDFYEEIFKNLEPFELVMGVDKNSYLPVYCSIDMAEMMDALMGAMYSNMGVEIDVEISKCTAFAEYSNYGNVSVEIPAEALNAEEIPMY